MKKLIITLLLLCTPAFAQIYTVERVIDGDTIKLTNGESVRLIGIDTPESRVNAKTKRDSERTGQDIETITKMGKEATEFMRESFGHTKLRLEYDVQKKDKYGRTLGYLYSLICLGKCKVDAVWWHEYVQLDDGLYVFINTSMIKAGYASPTRAAYYGGCKYVWKQWNIYWKY